jgi:Tol biopolymer transport system component
VTSSDTRIAGRTSSDGRWILYMALPSAMHALDRDVGTAGYKDDFYNSTVRLMRMPVTGGPPEMVLTARLYVCCAVWCARSPSTLCAFAEQTPDRKELVFTAFDPIRGKGHELARFATDFNANYNWGLSPDGTRIGILKTGGSHVYVLPLDGSPVRDLTVTGESGFRTFDWSADGRGFFIGNITGLRSTLLFVDLNGKAHPLWQQESGFYTWGVPSPDGRHLAVLGQELYSNMWMIENF